MAQTRFTHLLVEYGKVILSHKLWPVGVVLLSVPLAWPLVYTGWFADDLYQRAAYIDTPESQKYQPLGAPLKGPMRRYSFFDGDPERFQRMLDYGSIPWWCSPDVRAALWRPITAYFSMLDYWLWPESAEWMHVQSMLWFAILLLLTVSVGRRIDCRHVTCRRFSDCLVKQLDNQLVGSVFSG